MNSATRKTRGTGETCLLVMPRGFHIVSQTFRETLEDLGYEVTEANEEYPENALGRIMGKADLPLSRWLTARTMRRRFLRGRHYDLAMIVKGRGVSPALAREIGLHARRTVGYQFDALDYDPSLGRWCGEVDRMTTFDYRDAEERGWPVVELFSRREPPAEPAPVRYRLSVLMRNHSQRIAFLDRVMAALGPSEHEDFIYIFEKSRLSYIINFLRAPGPHWRWRRQVHFTPLPYGDYIAALEGSEFTLDYAHPRQRGATMRSFEALAVGVKLITNNPAPSANSRFFGPHNSVVVTDLDTSNLPTRLARTAAGRPAAHWRSPRDCVTEIIGAKQV
jgi:hypothetical protein